jgi:hypothetical protein
MEGDSAPMEGGRRRRSHKKLRLVKKKTVRRMLAKQGLRMRGGAEPSVPAGGVAETAAHVGGKRHRRKSHSRKRRGFTMKKLFKF